METALPLELYPATVVRAALFDNVKNGAAVRDAVVGRELECEAAIVDADLVLSTTVLRAACTNAARRADNAACSRPAVARQNDTQRSKSASGDLVYALSPSSSVGESLRILGVADGAARLLVVAFEPDAAVFASVLARIDGDRVPLAALDAGGDAKRRKVADAFRFAGHAAEPDALERAVLTRLATKDLK